MIDKQLLLLKETLLPSSLIGTYAEEEFEMAVRHALEAVAEQTLENAIKSVDHTLGRVMASKEKSEYKSGTKWGLKIALERLHEELGKCASYHLPRKEQE